MDVELEAAAKTLDHGHCAGPAVLDAVGPGGARVEGEQKIQPMTVNQLETFLACAKAQGSRREWTLFLPLADAGLRPARRSRYAGKTSTRLAAR